MSRVRPVVPDRIRRGEGEDDETLVSRTDQRLSRKRAEEELIELADELVRMSERALRRLDLPEHATEAIAEARRMQTAAARNRALRLVRAALRGLVPADIRARLRKPPPGLGAEELGDVTRWSERLVAEGDGALSLFVEAFPEADRKRLRTLVRNVMKAEGKAKESALSSLADALRRHVGTSRRQ